MEKTLNKIGPIEEKKEPKRQNKPWYTSKLLEQKKIIRNQERAYVTYREVNTGMHLPGKETDRIKC